MSRFGELNKQKTEIMINIISDTDLLKAIVNKQENFLEIDLPIEIQNDPTIIFYDNIFPYKFPSLIVTEEKAIISFGFGNYRKFNNVFKVGSVTFYIIIHKNLLKTDYGLRLDYILNKIDTLFNSNENIGIGVLEFENFNDLIINETYICYVISYKILEHN